VTDKQLNKYIDHLLDVPKQERLASDGGWARSFDGAMAMWVDRYPGTRPPAFAKLGPPPPCFSGETPPIYDEDLE
tara:strand:+ start:255 stop:479 length:225 start_codon:yes stop_codon:yes gene_type:complete